MSRVLYTPLIENTPSGALPGCPPCSGPPEMNVMQLPALFAYSGNATTTMSEVISSVPDVFHFIIRWAKSMPERQFIVVVTLLMLVYWTILLIKRVRFLYMYAFPITPCCLFILDAIAMPVCLARIVLFEPTCAGCSGYSAGVGPLPSAPLSDLLIPINVLCIKHGRVSSRRKVKPPAAINTRAWKN